MKEEKTPGWGYLDPSKYNEQIVFSASKEDPFPPSISQGPKTVHSLKDDVDFSSDLKEGSQLIFKCGGDITAIRIVKKADSDKDSDLFTILTSLDADGNMRGDNDFPQNTRWIGIVSSSAEKGQIEHYNIEYYVDGVIEGGKPKLFILDPRIQIKPED